jgi:hypothetical protein
MSAKQKKSFESVFCAIVKSHAYQTNVKKEKIKYSKWLLEYKLNAISFILTFVNTFAVTDIVKVN